MLTPEQLKEARQIAERANAFQGDFYHDVKVFSVEEFDEFVIHFNPQFVLQLLDRIEELESPEKAIKALAETRKELGW